jgi:mono/diheme cytochrome c family protein
MNPSTHLDAQIVLAQGAMAKFSLSLISNSSDMDCEVPAPRHGSPRSVVVTHHHDQEPLLTSLLVSQHSRLKLEPSKGSTTAARRVLSTPDTSRTMRVGPDKLNRSLQSTASTASMTSCSTLHSVPEFMVEATTSSRDMQPRRLSMELFTTSTAASPSNCSHRRHSLTTTALDTSPSKANDSLQETACRRCSSATNRKKRVRFLKRVVYYPADSLPLTKDECMTAWYTARDYIIFKRVLHNEIMDAREALEYNHYRHCFETVWHACHGDRGSTLEPNDNVVPALDWRDMLRPVESLDNAAGVIPPLRAGSPAQQLAASRFRGSERPIFARLVTTAQHSVAAAATQAVVQAYQVISDQSYQQRARRVRRVALSYSTPHQRLARVYAYGQAQLAASWQCREVAAMASAQRECLQQPPLLHAYDSQESLDSHVTPLRLGRRHRAKRRNLPMPDPAENTVYKDSMDGQTIQSSSSAQTTTASTSNTTTITTDALALVHDLNVTISRRHCRNRRRLSSNPASCPTPKNAHSSNAPPSP